jgi:ribosomal protein S6
MDSYEFTFLVEDTKEAKNVKEILEAVSAKMVSENNMGKRALAYPINKLTSAEFFTWQIEIDKSKVNEFKQKLNFNENIVRYILLKNDK